MKDYFGQVLKIENSVFRLAEANIYHALNSFHSHQEVELIYVKSGSGTFSIGQMSKRIKSGTIILIGSNVPHMFKFEANRYYDYATKHAKAPVSLELVTLHFDPNKLGPIFLAIAENRLMVDLLNHAKQGLLLNIELAGTVIDFLAKIETAAKPDQIPLLLQLFNKLAEQEQILYAQAGPSKPKPFKKIDETRLTMIYLYTMDNFYKEIKLKEIADLVHMVPNAFCHYFKSRTGKSYFDFLISVRIEHACKLLREENDSVSSICHDSGFTNLSNFNRYFKLQTGTSPLAYRQLYRQ